MRNKPVILVIDDNITSLCLTSKLMEDIGYDVVTAESGIKAFDFLKREIPDLILLDMVMPEMDGTEFCKRIKEVDSFKHIPIIILSSKSSTDDIVNGLQLGAVDYITKPFNALELSLRVKNHLETKRFRDEALAYANKLEALNAALSESNQIIRMQNEKQAELLRRLDKAAKTDYLTGLKNRRQMSDEIDKLIKNYAVTNQSFAILLGDIDFFKKINDTFGHDAGDFILKYVSDVFMQNIRFIDSVSRWGGEEFLILVPGIKTSDAVSLANRIRLAVESTTIMYKSNEIKVTITIGVAIFDDASDTKERLIKRADQALYRGKNSGRNKVYFEE